MTTQFSLVSASRNKQHLKGKPDSIHGATRNPCSTKKIKKKESCTQVSTFVTRVGCFFGSIPKNKELQIDQCNQCSFAIETAICCLENQCEQHLDFRLCTSRVYSFHVRDEMVSNMNRYSVGHSIKQENSRNACQFFVHTFVKLTSLKSHISTRPYTHKPNCVSDLKSWHIPVKPT